MSMNRWPSRRRALGRWFMDRVDTAMTAFFQSIGFACAVILALWIFKAVFP